MPSSTKTNPPAMSPWTTLAASEIGTSHIRKQLPCQDACQIVTTGGLLVAGALSDGVGSAACSEIGSQLAVETATVTLVEHEVELLSGDPAKVREICDLALGNAVAAVKTRAAADKRNPDDYACTLILLLAAPGWVAALNVGDGFVVWRAAGSAAHEVLLGPEKEEFVNYTSAITSSDLAEHARFEIRQSPPGFLLVSSDGLLFLALKKVTWLPHAPFFQFIESFARRPEASAESLRAMLRSPQVNELTDDDKSLLLVCSNRPDPPTPPHSPPKPLGNTLDTTV